VSQVLTLKSPLNNFEKFNKSGNNVMRSKLTNKKKYKDQQQSFPFLDTKDAKTRKTSHLTCTSPRVIIFSFSKKIPGIYAGCFKMFF
jgi:hypothetical protein